MRLATEDFEVAETDRRTSAAVCLLVDLSYSMVLRDTWGAAKATALALHALVSGQFPQDALTIIGFSSYARTLSATELAGLDADYVQGTNLQHALMLAGRFLDKHPDGEPVVLVVTDGEPTAHLLPGGRPYFAWPPEPETLEATVVEVDRMTRRGRHPQRVPARRRPAADAASCRSWPGATAAGCCCPTRGGSASTSSATTCPGAPAERRWPLTR